MAGLDRLVRGFSRSRMLVLGDPLLDRYRWGHSAGVCREGPVPTIVVEGSRDLPGGAGNTAANAAALGAATTLVGLRGDDRPGRALERGLRGMGVRARLLADPGRGTVVKQRVLADGQLVARFDEGVTPPLPPSLEHALLEALRDEWREADAVVVADYDGGLCTPAVVETVRGLQGEAPRPLVVDARGPRRWAGVGALAVKPNAEETALLLGTALPAELGAGRIPIVTERGDELLDALGARLAAVTLDADGVVLVERGRTPHVVVARPSPSRRAAGAGDTFSATLALALAGDADGPMAAEVASTAAALAVRKPFTAVCGAEELRMGLRGTSKRVEDGAALAAVVRAHRARGARVVFTNGCFDLLHRGHVSYLNRAKLLGDVLVVAVNDDASVRRLKGPERPLQPIEDRLQVLAALGCVDHVVAFSQDSPAELIEAARPDVYVKGGDYTKAILPEAELVERLGGVVQLVGYVEDRSTTGLVRRIRARQEEPAT